MKIGIDLSVLNQQMTGVPRYAFLLAESLVKLKTEHQFVFFVNMNSSSPRLRESEAGQPPLWKRGGVPSLLQREGKGEFIVLPERKIPFWSRHIGFAREIERAKLDVFHGTANVLPWFLSTSPASGTLSRPGEGKGRGRTALTIHDLAIYRHPEWFAGGQWFGTKFVVPRSIKRADKIIVPSQVTKRDLMELFGVREERIAVIPLGVEERFFRNSDVIASSSEVMPTADLPQGDNQPTRLPRPEYRPRNDGSKYILFVGTNEPRKNVQGVVAAYRLLPEEIRERYALYVVGQRGAYRGASDVLRQPQRAAPPSDDIRYLGYIPDEDLPGLYQGAAVFVYPSFYEGFGLPVLEAMAAGVPVVTSKGTAMEEIATSPLPSPGLGRVPKAGEVEPAVALIDPHNPQEIADAITKLIRDNAYSSEKTKRGVEVARRYTWEKVARRTFEIYEELTN